MVVTWMVFAWANVNLLVQAEVEGKSSSQVKKVEKSKDDYELELIEKGYIFFPPREIKKPQIESTKNNTTLLKESTNKTADKKGIESAKTKELKTDEKNKENSKPTVIELDKEYDQELKRVETYKNELFKIIEKNKTEEKSRIKIVPTDSEYKYGKYTLKSLLNEASEFIRKKEDEKNKKYEINIEPDKKELNLPELGGEEKVPDQKKKIEEIKNNITSRSKEIKIDEEQRLLIGQNNSNYSYTDYSGNSIFNIGVQNNSQYRSVGLNKPSYTASGATQLRKEIAVGFNYKYFDKKNDLTISVINNIPDTNIYAKVAGGVMDGKEIYNYFSGPSETHVQQYNALASLNYRNPNKFSNLKGMGINIWKIIAKQKSRLAPNYITKETESSYDTYMDPRELALGNVTGYSGTVRLKINNSLSAEQSFGKENLVYPLSDGTRESYKKNYLKSLIKYQIDGDSSFELSLSSGSVENKTRIEYANSGFGMSIEKVIGLNGLKDYWYVGVTYSISDYLNPKAAAKYIQNYDNEDYLEHISLLRDVSKKPSEFPTNFLAKVDPTSIKLISSVKKEIITWSSSGLLGSYYDSIVPNRNNISIQLSALNSSYAAVKYQTTLVNGALPIGLTLDENGIISGTAAPVNVDTTYTFKVKAVSEGAKDKVSPDLSIIIKAPNSIQWFSNGNIATLNDTVTPSRTNVSIQLDARTNSPNTLIYETTLASGSLPPGLTLNANGLISGTTNSVLQDTTYTFTVNVHTSDVANTQSQNLSITILKPQPTIVWTSNGLLSTYNDSISPNRNNIFLQLNATNTTNAIVKYQATLVSGALPIGLSLDEDGWIRGNAAPVTVDTTYTFKVKAISDGAQDKISSDLSIIIKAPNSIQWFSSGSIATLNDSVAPSRTNVLIQLDARTNSPNALIYETTLASGSLPPGLTINANGLISGTTNSVLQDTTYTFTVNVHTSDVKNTQSKSLTITILKSIPLVDWRKEGVILKTENCSQSSLAVNIFLNKNLTSPASNYVVNSGSIPNGLVLNVDGSITGSILGVEADTVFTFTIAATLPDGSKTISPTYTISKKVNGSIFNPANGFYYRAFSMTSGSYSEYVVNQAGQCYFGLNGSYVQATGRAAIVFNNDILNFINNKIFPGLSKPKNIYISGTSGVNGPFGLIGSANSLSSELLFNINGNQFVSSIDLYTNGVVQNNLIPGWGSDIILDKKYYSDGYLTLDLSSNNPKIVPKLGILNINSSVIYLYEFSIYTKPLF
jgi:hypothetical protein